MRTEFAGEGDVADLLDTCSFTVHQYWKISLTETTFFDEGGAVTRIDWHAVEQDTFTANGKSLVSVPYTFNVRYAFDSQGTMTGAELVGAVMKIWLPDGSLFFSAGRTDWLAHGIGPIMWPDHGVKGNIAGFCAALQ